MNEKTKIDMGNFKANTTHHLRGDYSDCNDDYSCNQKTHLYTDEMHKRWHRLFTRQSKIVEKHAIDEYKAGLKLLDCKTRIPDLNEASEILMEKTGWMLVAVPGLIPNDAFFKFLAKKKFPVAYWIREESEIDYLVEPDIFHDFYGHVPLLANKNYANYMEKYGIAGLKAIENETDHILAALYWYTVEFGLYEENNILKAYGAGMLSSKDETLFSVKDKKVKRVYFDLERILRTKYMVDDFQKIYFVVNNFFDLFESIENDITDLLLDIKNTPQIDAGAIVKNDKEFIIP